MHRRDRRAPQASDPQDSEPPLSPRIPPAVSGIHPFVVDFDFPLAPGVARRLLQQFERDGIDATSFPASLRLRRGLLRTAVDSGDVAAFESEYGSLRRLLRRARAGGWLDRDVRRGLATAVRDDIARATADLCIRGSPPRFGIVRASLRHAMAVATTDARGGRWSRDGTVAPSLAGALARSALGQCLGTGSLRRARSFARSLRKHLQACGPAASIPSPTAIACTDALISRWGASDRELASAAAIVAAHALSSSAAAAAESAEAVLSAPGASDQHAARALAHAVACRAWLLLGDSIESARHAAACREVPIGRVARRWGRVSFACELIDAARARAGG
jgi:hypothetical protein